MCPCLRENSISSVTGAQARPPQEEKRWTGSTRETEEGAGREPSLSELLPSRGQQTLAASSGLVGRVLHIFPFRRVLPMVGTGLHSDVAFLKHLYLSWH